MASLSARRSNRFFKAIRIRDDLLFWGSNSNSSKDIEQKDLKNEEQQKQVKIQKLVTITNKKQTSNNFLNSVLEKCKLPGGTGPCYMFAQQFQNFWK